MSSKLRDIAIHAIIMEHDDDTSRAIIRDLFNYYSNFCKIMYGEVVEKGMGKCSYFGIRNEIIDFLGKEKEEGTIDKLRGMKGTEILKKMVGEKAYNEAFDKFLETNDDISPRENNDIEEEENESNTESELERVDGGKRRRKSKTMKKYKKKHSRRYKKKYSRRYKH
jgi:hypothetical protein